MVDNSSLKVAIYGAGSIGCYLGGLLAHAGCNVTFVGRESVKWGLQMRGLTLTHFKRKPIQIDSHAFQFFTDARGISEADLILLTVKSQDTFAAAKEIVPRLKSGAMLVSFQNGVRNVATLRQVILSADILAGMVPFNVTSPATAEYHSGTEGDLIIEQSDDPRVKTMMAAFKKSGQSIKSVKDIQATQWGKLIINLNNALNTLHGDTLKTGLAQREYRLALAAMMEEALTVAGQAGISVGPFGKTAPEKVIKILRKPNFIYGPISSSLTRIDASARSSMLDDLENGKKCEIQYLQGEIVQLAENTLQRAPINQIIMEAVQAAFGTGASPRLTGKNMWELVDAAKRQHS